MLQPRHSALVHEQNEFAETRAAGKAESARCSAMAARVVASHSLDADDCTALLAMLGLDPAAGKAAGAD